MIAGKLPRLDGLLLWPYKKAILLALLLPIAFAAINRSLLTGVSFAMCFAAMTTGYPFFLAEKNRMERLYAMLPVRKSAVVAGRYIGVLLLGAAALGISLAAQPLVLRALGEKVSAADVAGAAVAGALLFALYTVFQLPGYYRFGFLRGRIFMYIPVAAFWRPCFCFRGRPPFPCSLRKPWAALPRHLSHWRLHWWQACTPCRSRAPSRW